MLSTLYQRATSITETIQSVQESFGPSAKQSANYVQDEVLAKIGQKRTMKTPQGTKEIVELGPLGNSLNVTKVRCLTTDKEYCLKRMALGNNEKDGNSKAPAERATAMVSLEALQCLADKAEALPNIAVHQNVVKVFSAQVDNTSRSHGQVFLMELCEESVAETIESHGPMTAEEVLKMIKDVAEGLQFLHSQKEGPVIHGSVETSHVLKGKGGEYKLASFGATHFDADSQGSPKVKSDIWQLGILIFMSMFGIHPFSGEGEKSEAANSLKKGCALAVPHGRPKSLLEGRLCILMHWLLVPDACLRPSAKQVSVLLGHLEKMVASQLIKALPPPVQKTVCNTLKGAERQTLVDGLEAIPTHIGRNLVREYGEGLLLNPKLIPQEKLNELMPRAIMSRIKELQTLYGIQEGASQVKAKKPKEAKQDAEHTSTAKANADTEEEVESDEAVKEEAAPVDLMDLGDKPQSEAKDTPVVVDLMDFGEEAKIEEKMAEPSDLLDMGNTQELKTSGSSDLLDMDDATAEVQQPEVADEPAGGDLLDMGMGSVPDSSPTSAPQAAPQLDMLDMGMGSVPDSSPQAAPQLDMLDMGMGSVPDSTPTSAPQAAPQLDMLDMGMGSVPDSSHTSAPPAAAGSDLDMLDMGMGSVPASTHTSAPPAAPQLDMLDMGMGSPPAATSAAPQDHCCNPFGADFQSAPVVGVTTAAPITPMAAPAPTPMMAGYPAMVPVMTNPLAAPQGNAFAQVSTPAGNPFAAPAPQGNPFAAAAPQGNPFAAPAASAPEANPFEESHDDAFAFAVSNLKGKMSKGQ